MVNLPPQYRSLIDQLAAHATAWAARTEIATQLLTLLVEDDDKSFVERLVATDAALVRSLLVMAIFEALEKAERAEDPEDVLYLSIEQRCELERLMTVLGEVKDAGVTEDQSSKIDTVIGILARHLEI